MIPRLAAGGASFKGAALYYLHDKREEGETARTTTSRVAWTYTLNLPTDDPDRAWRMMADTATAAPRLKAAAGIKATGRKLAKPVMSFSLAWSPKEPPPAPHEMLEAAQEALAALGLEEHQAIIVAHQDTAHPHVHVIVNRVHPDNGVAHTGSVSKLRLSEWAEDYESRRGKVLCLDRVANNAERRARRPADRKRRVSRPEWAAARQDPRRAAEIATALRDMFGDLAAIERHGIEQRRRQMADLLARRRADRQAIRDRYQAAADAAADPARAAQHAKLADALMQADPALGLAGVTEDRSTFTRADLVRHVGRHTNSVTDFAAVLARLEASPEIVPLGFDSRGDQRFTTREFQDMERRMLDHATAIHARQRSEIQAVPVKGIVLSKDQDAALRHVLAPTGLAAIIGYAGTGKSTLLGSARRSFETQGYSVQGMTISGVAADGLKAGSGIDSQTVAKRLLAWDDGRDLPTSRDVIVVDEAGMLGSRQMERILRHAAKGGAKVVLVGDYEQLQAIDAGGAFRSLAGRFGAAKLDTVRRQRETWQQQATVELATGRIEAALNRYRDAGMEHAHASGDEARAALIAQWQADRAAAPQASRIVLAYTRADVADLNARARAVLREAGQLGPDVRLTTESGRKSFAAGDRIYFLKNDSGLNVRNGTLATIKRIEHQSLVVQIDGEPPRELVFGVSRYNHFDHGYAATVHKSQGVTVDRAYLLAGKMLNRHAAYVAMSRHRERLDLYWSEDTFRDRTKMVHALSREALKDTSLDYDDAAPAPRRRAATPLPQPAPTPISRGAAGQWSRRKLHVVDPSPRTPADIGRRARERARAASEVREAKSMAAAFTAANDPGQPLAIEGPRPEDRPLIISTAELVAFDRETVLLAQALGERHDAASADEDRDRRVATLDAAQDWADGARYAPAPEPPRPTRKTHRGPSFDL